MAQHGTGHDVRQISGASRIVSINVGGGDQTFEPPLKGMYIGTAGNVRVISLGGDDVTFVDLAPGIWHPMPVKIVKQSGTTALNIVGGYDI